MQKNMQNVAAATLLLLAATISPGGAESRTASDRGARAARATGTTVEAGVRAPRASGHVDAPLERVGPGISGQAGALLERVAPGIISTDGGEGFPSLSPDGQTLWFATHDESWSHHQIVYSRQVDGAWTTPQMAPFSGASWSDRAPRPTPDGRRLYFASNRPSPGEATHDRRDYDIWVVERAPGGGWGAPTRVPEPVSTTQPEYHPSMASSGALYFASFDRPGGQGRSDLYVARPTETGWAVEALSDAINSSQSEPDVYVDPAERFLIVTSTERLEGLGNDDLYLSVRREDGWSPLVHLGEPVNSDAFEYGATVSPDGRWLWLTSHRGESADIYRIETSAVPALAEALSDRSR